MSEVRSTRLDVTSVAVASLCLIAAGAVAVLTGAAGLDPIAVVVELADRVPAIHADSGLSEMEAAIVWELRLPRVVLGALVGAMLAAAGASYQGVFRNPLADPYLLGIAAGAGLGATIAFAYLAELAILPIHPVPIAAFVGATIAVAATYLLGSTPSIGRTPTTLILSGVAVAAFFTAVQTYVQQRESDTFQQVYSWILGRLTTAGWQEVLLIAPYFVVSATTLLLHRRLLDALTVGEEEAATFGLNPARIRVIVVGAATLGTAAAVSVSGLIGFVGIIVPHAVRLLLGASYRLILPLSVLFGATFLVLVDVVARTVAAPAEIPIGVITALLGAPFFVVVLRTSRRLI